LQPIERWAARSACRCGRLGGTTSTPSAPRNHSSTSPGCAALWEQSTTAYRQALKDVAEHLRDKGLLTTDVPKAIDALWFCFGFGAWRTLVRECGWSWDDAERWLAQQAITIFTH
jgi:hypothetical protein